jgi:glycine cleavage system aminomethyltransferase T
MMASAVRTYVNRFGVAAGRKIAIFTTTDDGWKTAADLTKAGVGVEAVIDARRDATAPIKINRAWFGAHVIDTHGSSSLRAITVRDRDGNTTRLNVDTLAVSGGWNPAVGLTTHLGQRPKWSHRLAAFVPGELPRGISVAGAATGALALSDALKSGSQAGADAAKDVGKQAIDAIAWRTDDEAVSVAPLWVVESRSKSFVDFQNDVTSEDVALAAREGFRSVELLKRYTTLGMATDQGRTSNVNGLAIMAALTERSIPEVGTTTFRPPYTPVAIAAMSGAHRGKHSSPTRYTAGHAWAMERGASFVEAGDWLRAQWFAAPTDTSWRETVTREVKTVRANVGVCDVSTLGKIDVQGADAATFLDRVYINTYSTLPVGKTRYGLMLREDGFVMDDGTTARLARDRYIMSTTTANAARVMQHLEHARQILWPQLDVQLASATEQWSQYSIAGPKSRQVLDGLLHGALDVSNEAFPYMACAEFNWNGRTARLFRISFSGELGYELAVPARYGDATIRAIMAAGEPFGITPYGLEALGIMRLEKGHIAGAELNGTTTAADLGLGRMMSAQKDFIGKVLSKRPALMDTQRAVLVGIKPVDRWAQLRGGSHLLTLRTDPTLENDQGYITSANFSPMLEQWIGLGLALRGRERIGERIRVYDPLRDGDFEADIVDPVFFDPEGARLRA